ARCLAALSRQTGVEKLEILVPWDGSWGPSAALEGMYRGVRFLSVPSARPRTTAELRALGARAASGEIVALTEDHCAPEPDWCARILEAHRLGHAAVGGAVEKITPDGILPWAFFLADYLRYMNPLPEGPAAGLTDCNVSYKRAALEAIATVWAVEFHEHLVHAALAARGGTLWFSPRVVVRQGRPIGWRAALHDRYAYGRLFGSTRVAGRPSLARAVAACLIPPLQIARIASGVARRRRCAGQFLRCLPALAVLATAWACGEFAGYLTGRPDPSLTPGDVS
ncbi:MAG: glycosyltransferase, partial [Candidatus Solibacter usitatus]|nr:glycosyltransferase [Candidatus Solibacter usitatus]